MDVYRVEWQEFQVVQYFLGVYVYFSLLEYFVFGFHLRVLDAMTSRLFVLVVEHQRVICRQIVVDSIKIIDHI